MLFTKFGINLCIVNEANKQKSVCETVGIFHCREGIQFQY